MHCVHQWEFGRSYIGGLYCNGTESCAIVFLQRNAIISRRDNFVGQFDQIIELYDISDNEVLRQNSNRNKGIASFCLLKDIQELEQSKHKFNLN